MEKRHSFLARAAMMLLLAVFTTMTAWATNATPLTSTEGLKLVPGLSATGSSNSHSWALLGTATQLIVHHGRKTAKLYMVYT